MWTPYIAARGADQAPASHSIRAPLRTGAETGKPEWDDTGVDYGIVLILLAGLSYNALLAIANAHVAAMSLTQVALSEFVILAAGAALIIRGGLRPFDTPCLIFALGSLLGTLTLSKNTSLVSWWPSIVMIGRTVRPGVFMSISRYVMPCCFLPFDSVRTRQNIQSA